MNRSWTEISLDTIKNNYLVYKSQLPAGQQIMAVVKADAYGHGDIKVATLLAANGCKDFAVSNIEEAIKLRKAGIEGQILILGYTPITETENLIKYDITQALVSEEYASKLAKSYENLIIDLKEYLAENSEKPSLIKTQFAIDTGMNRIGLDADDVASCEKAIRKYSNIFNMTGIFTHLCVADTPSEDDFTNSQIDKFIAVADSVKDLKLPYIHCNNTAAGLWHNGKDWKGLRSREGYGTLTRLGISLYGLKPDYANVLPNGIKPALSWKSVISMVKTVKAGETVGYGRTFAAKEDMTVATIPTGYADGYNRFLSNKGYVVVRGKKCPVIGRVCMDQFMVDVSGVGAALGEEVYLLTGNFDANDSTERDCNIYDTYTADDMAHDIGTIGYEIVCNISSRVERRYL